MRSILPICFFCLTWCLNAQVSFDESFLSQASVQVQAADRHQVARLGPQQWFEAQIRLDPQLTEAGLDDYLAQAGWMQPSENQMTTAWQAVVANAPDQLRQRTAYALSRLFALPDQVNWQGEAFALAHCYDQFLQHTFSSYEEVLLALIQHPVTAHALGYLNSTTATVMRGESKQLQVAHHLLSRWTIGQEERFSPQDLQQLALVFTGFGASELTEFAYLSGYDGPAFGQPYSAIAPSFPLHVYRDFHDQGAKQLLGTTLPARPTGLEEVRAAIRHLVQRPSTATHLSRELIRHLLQVEPEPVFVDRVAAVFRDNGQGQWGDLKAVWAAILLDNELRYCPQDVLDLSKRYQTPNTAWSNYLPALPGVEQSLHQDCSLDMVQVDLAISPNPVASTTWIALGEAAPGRFARVRIVNSAGRQLWIGVLRAGQRELAINVTDWPPSLYFVQYEEGNYRGIGRFVKS